MPLFLTSWPLPVKGNWCENEGRMTWMPHGKSKRVLRKTIGGESADSRTFEDAIESGSWLAYAVVSPTRVNTNRVNTGPMISKSTVEPMAIGSNVWRRSGLRAEATSAMPSATPA